MSRILGLAAIVTVWSFSAYAESPPVIPVPPAPVPAPAGLPLILMAVGMFALLRKKHR